MRRILLISTFFSSMLFSQVALNNINFQVFIGEKYAGFQINPVLTGLKGKIPNQEIDLNLTMFYHNKYSLHDDQVLGMLEGRLITEFPLSSFDMYKKNKEDTSLVLSNYIENSEVYQKALLQYQLFQKKIAEEYETIENDNIEGYETVTDEIINNNEENYEEYETIENDNMEGYEIIEDETTKNMDIVEDVNSYNFNSNNNINLSFMKPRMLAQSLYYKEPLVTDLPKFPSLQYTNTDPMVKTMSPTELEFLIRFEKIKEKYNEAVKTYNDALKSNTEIYKDDFDPSDPAERFTIILMGDHPNSIWIKNFGLYGKKRYQSYNQNVWYLGYQIELTKKDIRALYNVFKNNKNVKYIVKGSTRTVEFDLSPYFKSAVNELLDLYVRGKFAVDTSTEYPMMSNYDKYLK